MSSDKFMSIASGIPEIKPMGGPGFSKKAEQSEGFDDLMVQGMEKVNAELVNSNKMSEEFLTQGKHDLHEVMIAIEKADISFKFMNQVRNKVLDAYNEVMRIQV